MINHLAERADVGGGLSSLQPLFIKGVSIRYYQSVEQIALLSWGKRTEEPILREIIKNHALYFEGFGLDGTEGINAGGSKSCKFVF